MQESLQNKNESALVRARIFTQKNWGVMRAYIGFFVFLWVDVAGIEVALLFT